MSFKVDERVLHKGSMGLGPGRIVAIVRDHDNVCHDKPGPWFRIEWDRNPALFAGRLFHGDVLVAEKIK